MKTTHVTVHFANGLHARPAAKLVLLCREFRARVFLRLDNRVANAKSIMGILLLAATFEAQLEVQASGADEDSAIQATEVFFRARDEEALPPVSVEPSSDKKSVASA